MYKATCNCGWKEKCGKGVEGHVKAIVSVYKHEKRCKGDARVVGRKR